MATEVDPGNIEEFGKRMQELATYWAEPQGAPMRVLTVARSEYSYPEPGDTVEGDALIQAYNGRRQMISTTFNALYTLLETFGKGSKKVAEQYSNAEALSKAKVGQIDALLAQEMQPTGTPGQTPTGPVPTPTV